MNFASSDFAIVQRDTFSAPRCNRRSYLYNELIVRMLSCGIKLFGIIKRSHFHMSVMIHASFLYILRENPEDLIVKFLIQNLCFILDTQEPVGGNETLISRIYSSYDDGEVQVLKDIMSSRYLVSGFEEFKDINNWEHVHRVSEIVESLPIPNFLSSVNKALSIIFSLDFCESFMEMLSRKDDELSLKVSENF